MIYAKRRKLESLKRTKERKKSNSAMRMRQINWVIFYVFIIKPVSAPQKVT